MLAASTVGTNLSTTGTFTQTVGSATAARFQNAAGTTTVLQVDTTNTRVGVNAGGTVDTTFEVGGTASISGLALFGGNASVAGNFELTSATALLGINAGNVIDTTLEVGGTASISGIITLANGQIRPQTNSTTAFRFQNAAGTTSVLSIDTTNNRVGIGAVPGTTFEVEGTASASYFFTGNTIQVGGTTASTAYSRFGTTTTTHAGTTSGTNSLLISGGFEVDGSVAFDGFSLLNSNASVSSNFSAGAGVAGTSSFNFDNNSATTGACIKIKDGDGSGYTYLRVSNGTGTFSTTSCR